MDGITSLDPDYEEEINTTKMRLKTSLNDNDLEVIYDWTVKIAQESMKLFGTPMGIGYNVDEKLGTDIVITFKQEIMFHPDANFSIQAETRFYSAKIYPDRPWVKDQGAEEKHVEDFHNSKLHCSIPRY